MGKRFFGRLLAIGTMALATPALAQNLGFESQFDTVLGTEVRTPQNLTNHWGVWVPDRQAVDNAYALLKANKDKYGLLRVQNPRLTHEGGRDYSFYFVDIGGVWWEIVEHPDENEFVRLFREGDWDMQEDSGK